MERIDIELKVNTFLIEEMEIEAADIFDDAKLKDDLGLDSLDFIDIVVIVEKTFGFKIKPEDMTGVLTVKEFYDYIESKMTLLGMYNRLLSPSPAKESWQETEQSKLLNDQEWPTKKEHGRVLQEGAPLDKKR